MIIYYFVSKDLSSQNRLKLYHYSFSGTLLFYFQFLLKIRSTLRIAITLLNQLMLAICKQKKNIYFQILRFYLSTTQSQNRIELFTVFFTILGKSLAFFEESWVNVRIYFQHNLICKATKIWRNLPVDLTGKIRQIVLAYLENLIFSWQRIESRKLEDFFQFV